MVVTIEFSVAGLLPDLSAGLQRSLGAAAWLVSLFALASAFAGPFVTALLAHLAAPAALGGILLTFGAANLLAAAASSYPFLLAVRILEGVLLPAYLGLAAAAVTAGSGRAPGRALAGLNMGASMAMVVALPVTAALGGTLQWQVSFAALGLGCLVVGVVVLCSLPRLPASLRAGVREPLRLLAWPPLRSQLCLTALVFAALFCAYSYLTAWLREVAGYGPAQTAAMLAWFALAGLVGNNLAGRAADTSPRCATLVALMVLGASLVLVAVSGGRTMLFVVPLSVWGGAHTACFVLCQACVLRAAAGAPAVASALNLSSANLGIAFGATTGGWVAGPFGPAGTFWAAALLAIVAIAALRGTRNLRSSGPVDFAKSRSS